MDFHSPVGDRGRFTLLVGTHLGKCLLLSYKGAVSSSSCTIHTIWTAVPILIWAASSWTFCSIFTLLISTHLGKCLLLSYKWTVSSSSCTIETIRTTVPIKIWAASPWTFCSIFTLLI